MLYYYYFLIIFLSILRRLEISQINKCVIFLLTTDIRRPSSFDADSGASICYTKLHILVQAYDIN